MVICIRAHNPDNRSVCTDEVGDLRRRTLACPAGRVRDNGSGAL